MWRAPRRILQFLPTAVVLKCEFEAFQRLRDATDTYIPCGPNQSTHLAREMFDTVW
jgi:hypothetical protein